MNKKSIQSKHPIEMPLVVIVGPTASGKSATAMHIAKDFDGEIICSDSRTIYKGMDIGTAKPSAEDRVAIPHWGLDLVEPGDTFTAADFQRYAVHKIADIRQRGKLPILVGGTGLYVDAVIFDFAFGAVDPDRRRYLESLDIEALHKLCAENNIPLPENKENRRYVIRAIEQGAVNTKRRQEPLPNTIIVGIETDREVLRRRIEARSKELFANGMVQEAIEIGERYGWDSEAMTGNIYRLVYQFLNNEFGEDELEEKFVTSDWRLAKRQLTWLKRNKFIQWRQLDDAYEYIAQQLRKT